MKKAFSSDTAFRIYSVLIAILLWAFVVYNQNPESTKTVTGITVSYANEAELESQGLVILKSEREPDGRRYGAGAASVHWTGRQRQCVCDRHGAGAARRGIQCYD